MTKGIHAKDIRDFEKYAGKLNEVMRRIRAYNPEAYVYATPGQMNLMGGCLEEGATAQEEQEKALVATVAFDMLEAGDW